MHLDYLLVNQDDRYIVNIGNMFYSFSLLVIFIKNQICRLHRRI